MIALIRLPQTFSRHSAKYHFLPSAKGFTTIYAIFLVSVVSIGEVPIGNRTQGSGKGKHANLLN